jgi:hypothetical protein
MAPPKTALWAVRAARAGLAATAVATPPTLAAAAEAGSPVPAAPDPMHTPAPEAGGSRVLQGALEAPSGFGGGGGASAGSGGGYSGGGGAGFGGGGGGGSFDAGLNPILAAGVRAGDEKVMITELAPAVPEPSTWAMMATGLAGLAGLGAMRRRSKA